MWAAEMYANKAWLENLGMKPADLPHIEFPELDGSDCVRVLMNGDGSWTQQTLPSSIYMIFDESYRQSGHIGKATADWDVSHGNLYDWSDDNLCEVKKGWIRKADTLSGLARMVDIPPVALDDSVSRFNRFATTGKDSDWGRKAGTMAPLDLPPFYAMPLTPAFVNTAGRAAPQQECTGHRHRWRTYRTALFRGRARLYLFISLSRRRKNWRVLRLRAHRWHERGAKYTVRVEALSGRMRLEQRSTIKMYPATRSES
jgi:hypothetical protein